MWPWVVTVVGLVAIFGGLAAAGWYTGQPTSGRVDKGLSYVVASLGTCALAWAISTLLEGV